MQGPAGGEGGRSAIKGEGAQEGRKLRFVAMVAVAVLQWVAGDGKLGNEAIVGNYAFLSLGFTEAPQAVGGM